MKAIYLILSILFTTGIFSQQQQGNVYYENSVNPQIQLAQTNILINNINEDNNFNNQKIQKVNFMNDVENNIPLVQNSNSVTSNENSFSMSFNVSSRSVSLSNSSSNSRFYKRSFHKKLNKFNRNLYGKMSSHKKSKHLVDVCFFWS